MILVCNTRSKKPQLSGRLIMAYEGTNYHHSIVIINEFVFEAVGKGFRKIPLTDWLKDNIIVYECNPADQFNLSENDQLRILNLAESYVTNKIPYGFFTLLGIVLNDSLNIELFADGEKSLICSEALFRLFEEWLLKPNEPIDYISPKDLLIRYFKMIPHLNASTIIAKFMQHKWMVRCS